jgi:hypothetical protein
MREGELACSDNPKQLLAWIGRRPLAISKLTRIPSRVKLSVAVIAQSVERGERLKEGKSYHFPGKCKCEERALFHLAPL